MGVGLAVLEKKRKKIRLNDPHLANPRVDRLRCDILECAASVFLYALCESSYNFI